jgi:hypothetical protein
MARPSSFTQEIADRICERLVAGESLRAICSDDDMPAISTVLRWIPANPAFREQYAHARELQAETFADEINDIADDGSNDWMEKRNRDGDVIGYVVNGEAVQRSKLRVDARKWIASKLYPKKYGDKIETTLQGPDGGAIAVKTEHDLAAGLAFTLRKGLPG